MIRIVGLSATLPNYIDVARFLNVNPHKGLFYFDGRFRPVPLQQTFIGVKSSGYLNQMKDMEEICYEKALENVQHGHQVSFIYLFQLSDNRKKCTTSIFFCKKVCLNQYSLKPCLKDVSNIYCFTVYEIATLLIIKLTQSKRHNSSFKCFLIR